MRRTMAPRGVLALCVACTAPVGQSKDGERAALTRGQAVIGGSVVPEGHWDEVSSHDCSGVLIASRWVLTAGHCTAGNTHVQLRHRAEGHRVVNTVTYPNWQRTLDVGLLQLASESEVPPAQLAFGCASDHLVDGAAVQLVGYGATSPEGSHFSFELYEATTEVVDADCSGDWSCLVPGRELIAGHPGVDTCPGDSGGPLYLLSSLGPLLAGITSRAANPGATPTGGEEAPCGTVPGLYVRADAVVEWIEETIGETLAEPDCSASSSGGSPHAEASTFHDGGSLYQGEQRQLPAFPVQPGGSVTVTMTGAGDADLYVRLGRPPTLSRYHCRPYLESSDEQCRLAVPAGAEQLFVMIAGYTASSYELSVSYTPP